MFKGEKHNLDKEDEKKTKICWDYTRYRNKVHQINTKHKALKWVFFETPSTILNGN